MSVYFLLFALIILFLLIRFLLKINRNNSINSISNNYIDLAKKIELKSNQIISKQSIKTIEQPIKKENSFLNPNDDFGTMKKGVVLNDLIYEHKVVDD